MDIEALQGDVDEQEGGVWVKHNEGDWSFKIVCAHAPKASKWLDNAIGRARKKHRNTVDLPREVSQEITNEWLAKIIIKDWKNVTSQGKPIECTPENVMALLMKPSIGRRVADNIANECRDMRNFGVDPDSEDTEESPASAAIKSGPEVEPAVGK
jgi:hypothetical protein